MSFSSQVKDELALQTSEYEKDEISALFKCAGNLTISNHQMLLIFKSENSKIAQKVYRFIAQHYQAKLKTTISKMMKLNKKTIYTVIILDNVQFIIEDLGLIDETNLKEILKNEDRIRAYLAGLFMGCGSVNSPTSSTYHLELSVSDESFAETITKLLAKIDISAKIIKRRSQYVVYIKKAMKVADFICNIGATNTYLMFEDIRIQRDFYNNNNRVNNCDIANFVRTNMAAKAQLEEIQQIENYIPLKNLEPDMSILCQLRKENPEDSLKNLADKFNAITNKSITKSGINHIFIRIKKLAESLKSGEKNG